jgi:hypothetical protein
MSPSAATVTAAEMAAFLMNSLDFFTVCTKDGQMFNQQSFSTAASPTGQCTVLATDGQTP